MNVRHKLCRHPNCKLVPTYGTEGTRVPVACLEHSDEDMVDLKRARMRMSLAKNASSSSSSGEGAARSTGKAVPAVVERVGPGAGAGAAPAMAAAAAATAVEAAELVTGKKRPRAKAAQSLGGNAGIGRKIAEAIFASSQRVLEGEEAAAMEESEWEEEEEEASGEGNDDDDDEEDDAVEEDQEKEARVHNFPTAAGAEAESTREATALVAPLVPAAATGTSPRQPLPAETSLSWSCAVCSKPAGPDDRHVLVCCGHGVLHKACSTAFAHSQAPCPKCLRLVSSSLQVFV